MKSKSQLFKINQKLYNQSNKKLYTKYTHTENHINYLYKYILNPKDPHKENFKTKILYDQILKNKNKKENFEKKILRKLENIRVVGKF